MYIYDTGLKFSGSLTKRRKTTGLVIHHAAAKCCDAQDIHQWHLKNGWSGIGYHYLVRKNGTVHRGRPEDTVGAHAYGVNSCTIGVCFEGDYESETNMCRAQFDAGVSLCAEIAKRYDLGAKDIKKHSAHNATACPGKYFPFDALVDAVFSGKAEVTVREFQLAAIADGFKLSKFGADGLWGAETEAVAKQAVVKRRLSFKYKNLTRLVQRVVGVEADGLCGADTDKAIRAWQKANGLATDGAVGINSWKKILL